MANIDPKIMDELEEKKWLISRIDLYHKTMIDMLDNDLKKYEGYSDKRVSTAKSHRNNIFSILGVVLTVFLGFNSSYPVEQFLFFIIITVLGVIGFVVIIIYNSAIRLVEDFFSAFTEINTEGIRKLASSHGYFITRPAQLAQIHPDFVHNYYWFIMLLTSAIMVSNANGLKKFAKQFSRIKQIKSILISEAKEYEKHLQFVPYYYEKLDRSQEVVPELMEFIDKTLAEYKNKK